MARSIDGFNNWRKIKSLLGVTGGAAIIFTGYSLYQGNEKFYNNVAMPLVRLVDPEVAHRIAVVMTKLGLTPAQKTSDPAELRTTLWGLEFENPLGMAAGFDKHAEAVYGLHKMGFGFVEIGSVTPEPQPGNPKPRVFRLSDDRALINRYGFNSEGHEAVYKRLRQLKATKDTGSRLIVGVNLGKNKSSDDAASDYVTGVQRFSDVADYFVVNVSSPNTPGLRSLQARKELELLLKRVNEARDKAQRRPPLLLKIAPDLSEQEMRDVAEVVLAEPTKVDGLVVSNTTLSRENLVNEHLKNEAGGLSGAPVSELSTRMIAKMHQLTNGQLPIIGVGGIFDGSDAYAKIKAGASLIQIYTSFTYHGPPIVAKIKQELAQLLKQDGHKAVHEAVGKERQVMLSQSK